MTSSKVDDDDKGEKAKWSSLCSAYTLMASLSLNLKQNNNLFINNNKRTSVGHSRSKTFSLFGVMEWNIVESNQVVPHNEVFFLKWRNLDLILST